MDISLFLLVILLATPSPSLSEPSGKLGCRFSPVCDQDEVCAEDKLFGTCTQRVANYLPSYALDPTGLKRLKATVQYLLDQGFAWEDQYAQDSLQDVLYPYKHNIIPLNSDPRPPGNPQKPSMTDEEQQVWSNVDELAQAYQAVVDEYKQRYDVYNELINQYGLGGDEFDEYGVAIREKYLELIQTLKDEERESLQKLYDLYYDKYLSLLKMYSGPDEGMKIGVNNLEDAGEDGDDWEGMYKMQQLKEYLQLLHNENQDDLAPSDEGSEDLMQSTFSYQENWNDEFLNEILTEDAVPEEEEVGEEVQDEGAEEKEDIVDVILDSLDGNYWNSLPEEEKDRVMDEFFKLYFKEADISEEEQEEGDVKEKKGGEADQEEAAEAKGKGVGEPGQEFVEPLKQPKESGVNVPVDLAKKDDVATAIPELSGKDKTPAVLTTLKPTTFAPSGYVFIALQSGVSLGEAEMLVEELANALDAPLGSFTDIEAGKKQVTFKVHPDLIKMTPAEVAGAAATHQTDLEDMMGVTITETGVGKQDEVRISDLDGESSSYSRLWG
ncbi:receptor-type tyrosine-protein phosphatase N2-like [Asterias rubens]|uniref:receptor-type tyrosine-protein phosphatase N2-like n=1 Tax=Asterias rubens TaxID=7604 RepID=UPI0014558CC2|nr:receptor-type tyrosine-protein phosphatase N2-like [Asterias rubens]